ncbi:MAG: KEOPS complex kinase/ATPase Bud32 [archaeon]
MQSKFLKLGAEAKLTRKGDKLTKERIKKGYRLKEIDEPLRKQRTAREASLMDRARRAGVLVPKIYKVDKEKMSIEMDFLEAKRIDQVLTEELCAQTGAEIAKLHDADIIHGDLTTSNILVKEDGIYFIDFGLGEVSKSIEKKGVDLRVFKEAIRATKGEEADKYIDAAMKAYVENSESGAEVLKRLEKIETRGRYKER